MTTRTRCPRQRLARAVPAALLLSLCACSEPPPPRDARFEAVVVPEQNAVPAWYLVRFILRYPDGRIYEGECKWPDAYTKNIVFDATLAKGLVKPGKTVTSIREIEGSSANEFIPHGRGVMRYPGGRAEDGTWNNGRFVGRM